MLSFSTASFLLQTPSATYELPPPGDLDYRIAYLKNERRPWGYDEAGNKDSRTFSSRLQFRDDIIQLASDVEQFSKSSEPHANAIAILEELDELWDRIGNAHDVEGETPFDAVQEAKKQFAPTYKYDETYVPLT